MSHQPARHRPTVLAMAALMATSTLPAAWAQTQAAPATQGALRKAYTIDAGPLEDVLLRFTNAAGIALSFDPAVVAGQRSPGLQGSYGHDDGLRRVLQGSGLEAQLRADGTYVLRKTAAAAQAPTELPTVRVVGATEGTGSYTTELSNTATKLNLSLRETPQSVTVMTHKRLEDQNLTDVTEVLDQTVGVQYHNTNMPGADYNFMYSRGFVLQNFQVNGVPRSTRFGFQDELADTLVYDRAEIVRGASGLLSGIGEPSGAINLVRKLPTRTFQANAAVQVGSWDRRRAEVDVGGPLSESGQVRGRLVAGTQENGSFIERAKVKKDVLYGVAEIDLTPRTILSAGFEHQASRATGAGDAYSSAPIFLWDGTRANFGRSTNLAVNGSGMDRTSNGVFSTLEHYFDNEWRLRTDVEHVRRKYDLRMVQAQIDDASGAGAVQGIRWGGEPEQTTLTVHANGPYRLFGRTHELVVGANYMKASEQGLNYQSFYHPLSDVYGIIRTGSYPAQDLGPTGSSWSTHDEQSGLYAATRINPMDRWSVILGSRLSNWKSRSDSVSAAGVTTRGDTSQGTGEFTPYAGVVFELTDALSLYTSYTDIYQPATQFDANGKLLDPAQGSNIEAGFKAALLDKRLNVSAAVFSTKKDNVPEYVPNPAGGINWGPTGKYVYRAIDGTKTTGFELELAGELSRNWQLAGGYAYTRPKDSTGADRLVYLPKQTVKLFTAHAPAEWIAGLTLGANLRWQGSAKASANSYNAGFRQGSLTLVDLMAQYKIDRDWTLTLNVNNVFDKVYYTDIQVSGFYGAPRNANLTLRYAFH